MTQAKTTPSRRAPRRPTTARTQRPPRSDSRVERMPNPIEEGPEDDSSVTLDLVDEVTELFRKPCSPSHSSV